MAYKSERIVTILRDQYWTHWFLPALTAAFWQRVTCPPLAIRLYGVQSGSLFQVLLMCDPHPCVLHAMHFKLSCDLLVDCHPCSIGCGPTCNQEAAGEVGVQCSTARDMVCVWVVIFASCTTAHSLRTAALGGFPPRASLNHVLPQCPLTPLGFSAAEVIHTCFCLALLFTLCFLRQQLL